MRSRWAAVAGVALTALLVGAAWWLAGRGVAPPGEVAAGGTSPPAEVSPGATPRSPPTGTGGEPADAGAGTPEVTPPAGDEPSPPPEAPAAEVAPPTPSPAEAPATGPALVGTAALDDPVGDLVDSAGLPPGTPRPEADLTGVRLTGDGQRLVVEFEVAGEVPGASGSLVWSLDIWLDGTLSYTLTAQQVGARMVGGVLDWRSGRQVPPPTPPGVSGATVSLEVPRELLADVDGPFQWQAVGQADGGYEDFVPADGRLTWFPAP